MKNVVALPNKAQKAAERMMAKRGHVVVGFPAACKDEIIPGAHWVRNFAGHDLDPGWSLQITEKTTRSDWNGQVVALFGKLQADPNTHVKGERFYRCKLVKL